VQQQQQQQGLALLLATLWCHLLAYKKVCC
jgi:hypothetical protein